MGYLDGLRDVSFNTDEKGNIIFFPWGIFGKGYIIPAHQNDQFRLTIKRHLLLV
jgi:hypothetical protein